MDMCQNHLDLRLSQLEESRIKRIEMAQESCQEPPFPLLRSGR